jgi:hypothetical protein
MPIKLISMPSTAIGGILVCAPEQVKLATILPPMEVSVPLVADQFSIRTSINEYYCNQCEFKIDEELYEELRHLTPKEVALQVHKAKKCQGSRSFGTAKCLAGHTDKSNLFEMSVAKFTTPYLYLDTTFKVKRAGIDSVYNHSLFAFNDESLRLKVPYRNFNVHGDGRICWGQRNVPNNPKDAITEFFNSLTNSDLTRLSGHSLKYAIENWYPRDSWEEMNNTIYGADSLTARSNWFITKINTSASGKLVGLVHSKVGVGWIDMGIDKEDVWDDRFFIGWLKEFSSGTQIVVGKKKVYAVRNLTGTKPLSLLGTRKELNQ